MDKRKQKLGVRSKREDVLCVGEWGGNFNGQKKIKTKDGETKERVGKKS